MTFASKYGPWALVAGASDGVGAAFAKGLAERGVNVVLLARRQAVLDQVAAEITSGTAAQTRTLAVDLAHPDAAATIAGATADTQHGLAAMAAGNLIAILGNGPGAAAPGSIFNPEVLK